MSKTHQSIFDKLTDSSLYTGAHKHRFDGNGNGRGLAGRDRIAKGHGLIAGAPGSNVNDLSQITRSNLNTSGAGYAYGSSGSPLLYSRTSGDGSRGYTPLSPNTPARPASVGRNTLRTSYSGMPTTPTYGVANSGSTFRTSDAGAGMATGTARRSGGGSIFDKLTDPTQYTGAHKHRFDATGQGRGATGRTMANSYVSASANVMRR
ncbi:hypothetical protein HYH03_001025 [Edaphochlamys debaryana]|uniref:Uncharacterized protein n=1 Tax=Edaphochlamys debaryana TaxID=47281 RepID=A0A835YE36_9CHLO|nr:hypothetical protein HYH03_001025 [Edaphochlamys debaryana]|eukprot:KAG2501212.1 hypothetical protein HYH03_001025 [Edaphochlamys debaryana]